MGASQRVLGLSASSFSLTGYFYYLILILTVTFVLTKCNYLPKGYSEWPPMKYNAYYYSSETVKY